MALLVQREDVEPCPICCSGEHPPGDEKPSHVRRTVSYARATGAEGLEAEIEEICNRAEGDAKRLAQRSQKQSAEDRARGHYSAQEPQLEGLEWSRLERPRLE